MATYPIKQQLVHLSAQLVSLSGHSGKVEVELRV
jgi:hypothetical protein